MEEPKTPVRDLVEAAILDRIAAGASAPIPAVVVWATDLSALREELSWTLPQIEVLGVPILSLVGAIRLDLR